MNTTAFARLRLLVAGYVTLCLLTVVGEVVAGAGYGVDVGSAAWTRTAILVGVALIVALMTRLVGRGSAGALLRLRIVSAIQTVVTVVIVALPGGFPGWLRVEQALCALVLAGIVVVVNGRALRASVAARAVAG